MGIYSLLITYAMLCPCGHTHYLTARKLIFATVNFAHPTSLAVR